MKCGKFRVRGTVRSTKNPAKLEPLEKAFGKDLYAKLELVEADLLDEQSLLKAAEGCEYIVHTASPFPIVAPSDEMELINPAVNGTLAMMKAAHKNKAKRIVITSSVAAIYKSSDATKNRFTADDWTEIDIASPYEKSKTLAEKAAWDYVD